MNRLNDRLRREEAEREATDHVYKERLKREKQMEDVQEIVEPLVEAETSSDEDEEQERGEGVPLDGAPSYGDGWPTLAPV